MTPDTLESTHTGSLAISDDHSGFTFNNAPLMTLPAYGHLITIHGEGGAELAHVNRDGAVETAYAGAEEPAARAFWNAIQRCGVGLIARIRELEKRLAVYEPVVPYVM